MKVQNMTSAKGNKVANQFIITDAGIKIFQSYDSVIVRIDYDKRATNVVAAMPIIQTSLDSKFWDYSVTTGKYRNQFLGETKKETQAKIDSGEYILTNLN